MKHNILLGDYIEDNFGEDFIKSVWSSKNEKSINDYTYKNGNTAWFKCINGKHDDFERKVHLMTNRSFTCPICSREEGAKKLFKDLTGNVYGELTCIRYDKEASDAHNHDAYWWCRCSCGKEKLIRAASMKNGLITTCGNKKIHRSGANNGNWKGGITPERLSARTSKEYKDWVQAVYAKDWYTCQCCGAYGSSVEKNAHHLLNFSNHEDLRFDVSNGITLCKSCHYPTEKGSFHNLYGTQNNTPEQLEEYINSKRKSLGISIPFLYKEYLQGDILKPKTIKEVS